MDGLRAESSTGQTSRRNREGRPVSLRLDMATIAKIEADRIYDLILPEMEDRSASILAIVAKSKRKLIGAPPCSSLSSDPYYSRREVCPT